MARSKKKIRKSKRVSKRTGPVQKDYPSPLGIRLISIFGFAASIFLVLSGLFLLGVSPDVGEFATESFFEQTGIAVETMQITSIISVIGMIPLVFGGIGMLSFYMLSQLNKRAMHVVVTISVITVAISAFFGGFALTVVWIIIAGYLLAKRGHFN